MVISVIGSTEAGVENDGGENTVGKHSSEMFGVNLLGREEEEGDEVEELKEETEDEKVGEEGFPLIRAVSTDLLIKVWVINTGDKAAVFNLFGDEDLKKSHDPEIFVINLFVAGVVFTHCVEPA